VGIAGVPASGKSTFAQMLLKALFKYSTVSAILVGLDGWHYSRSELDAMPNAQLAHDRRGAHWTFDAESYVEFVRALRQDITEDSGVLTALDLTMQTRTLRLVQCALSQSTEL